MKHKTSTAFSVEASVADGAGYVVQSARCCSTRSMPFPHHLHLEWGRCYLHLRECLMYWTYAAISRDLCGFTCYIYTNITLHLELIKFWELKPTFKSFYSLLIHLFIGLAPLHESLRDQLPPDHRWIQPFACMVFGPGPFGHAIWQLQAG